MINYSAADVTFNLLCISLNNNDNNHDTNNALKFWQHEEGREAKTKRSGVMRRHYAA